MKGSDYFIILILIAGLGVLGFLFTQQDKSAEEIFAEVSEKVTGSSMNEGGGDNLASDEISNEQSSTTLTQTQPTNPQTTTPIEQNGGQNSSYNFDGKVFIYPNTWEAIPDIYTTPAGVTGEVGLKLKPINQLSNNDFIYYGGRQTSCSTFNDSTTTRLYCFGLQNFYAIPAPANGVNNTQLENSIPMYTLSTNQNVLNVFDQLVQAF